MKVKILDDGGFDSLSDKEFPVLLEGDFEIRNNYVLIPASDLQKAGFHKAFGSPYPFCIENFQYENIEARILED